MIRFHGRVAINKHYIIGLAIILYYIILYLNFVFYIVDRIVSFRSFKYRMNPFIFYTFYILQPTTK